MVVEPADLAWAVVLATATATAVALIALAKRKKSAAPQRGLPANLSAPMAIALDGPGTPSGDFGAESALVLADFPWRWGEPVTVTLETLLRDVEPGSLLPCSLDVAARCVIFAQTDLAKVHKATFMYQAQRQHAQRLYAVPFDVVIAAAKRLSAATPDWQRNVLLVHSTGRCGSTLLSKLLEKVGTVSSLSEPDVYTIAVAHTVLEGAPVAPPAELDDLLRAVTFCLTLAGKPGAPLAIKFRSQVVFYAEELKRALPDAHHIFLYRDGVDTVDSFCRAFFDNGVTRLLRRLRLDSWLIFRVGATRKYLPLVAPLTRDPRFPEALFTRIGYVGLCTMVWLSAMDHALALVKKQPSFFNVIITYEELVEKRLALIQALMSVCALKTTEGLSLDEAARVFDEDAHGPANRTKSLRLATKSAEPMYIRPADQADLLAILAAHDVIRESAFQLPGTLYL